MARLVGVENGGGDRLHLEQGKCLLARIWEQGGELSFGPRGQGAEVRLGGGVLDLHTRVTHRVRWGRGGVGGGTFSISSGVGVPMTLMIVINWPSWWKGSAA